MKTRFVCENCGKVVPYNADVCTFCGKMFSGVKCPACGTSGRPEKFRNGCPTCGYLALKSDFPDGIETGEKSRPGFRKIKRKSTNSIYILTGMLLIMLLSVFVILIMKGNL